MSKFKCYQDYVIKEGKLIAEFEQMYLDHEDPWEQTTREACSLEKKIAINWCQKLKLETQKQLQVIEIGCGLGWFTNQLSQENLNVMGIDVSHTAIKKARHRFPHCQFAIGDILNFHIYEAFNPTIFIMAEVTWYVLDKLDAFTTYLKKHYKGCYLIHLLTTYQDGEQLYGRDYFTNLSEILSYYKLEYIEFGETTYTQLNNCKRTYFLAKI